VVRWGYFTPFWGIGIIRRLGVHHLSALCPRIRLRLTEMPLPKAQRVAGEGTLDQGHADLKALQGLGASHVLLDTFYGNMDTIHEQKTSWRMLPTLAEKVVDLRHETLQ
jgi:hypothetical protein